MINTQIIKEQQRIADLFYQLGILQKKIDVSLGMLSSQEYAALAPKQ